MELQKNSSFKSNRPPWNFVSLHHGIDCYPFAVHDQGTICAGHLQTNLTVSKSAKCSTTYTREAGHKKRAPLPQNARARCHTSACRPVQQERFSDFRQMSGC